MSHLTLYPENGCGFFSCCTCRLENIIQFFNAYKTLPKHVDSCAQFSLYKENNSTDDITYNYFIDDRKIDIEIPYHFIYFVNDSQYTNYKSLNLIEIVPFINKYFSPSAKITHIMEEMEKKYKLDYKNTCVLFYRGNDKVTEIEPNSYDEYYESAQKILQNNPHITFLIQSDEQEFIDYFREKFPNNSFVFEDETRRISREKTSVDLVYREKNHHYSKYFLAIIIMMSQCEFVISNTGNCSLWVALYRAACAAAATKTDYETFIGNFHQLEIKSHTSWCSSGFVAR